MVDKPEILESTLTLADNNRASELTVGSIFAEAYKIEAKIGAGGMGSVYLAKNIGALGKTCAIKVLDQSIKDEVRRARFREEARIMANFSHPNIVPVYHFGTDKVTGLDYYLMEAFLLTPEEKRFVCGSIFESPLPKDIDIKSPLTLSSLIEGGKTLPEPALAKIFTQILSAIEAAHNLNPSVVHRDIKPSNIIIASDGRVLLSDFGIAKRIYSDDATTHLELTRSNAAPGTWIYSAPEQREGGKITKATDYYSLGLVLFRTLTGGMPNNTAALPVDIAPTVSKRWQSLLPSLLENDPAKRLCDPSKIREILCRIERDFYARLRVRKYLRRIGKGICWLLAIMAIVVPIIVYQAKEASKFDMFGWERQKIESLQRTIDLATPSLHPDQNGVIVVKEGQTLLSGDIPKLDIPVTIFLDGGDLLFSHSTEDLRSAIRYYKDSVARAKKGDDIGHYFSKKKNISFRNKIIVGAAGGTLSVTEDNIFIKVRGDIECAEGVDSAELGVYGFSEISLYSNAIGSGIKIKGQGSVIGHGGRRWFDSNNPYR